MQVKTLALIPLIAACGGSPSARPAPAPHAHARHVEEPAPEEEKTNENDDLQVEGALGSIDMSNVQRVIQANGDAISDCQTRNIGKLWYIGGQMTLKFRIARDGTIKSFGMTDSDVGNYGIERCVADLAFKLDFGKPKRGEAEFSFPISFDARANVKVYNPPKLEQALAKVNLKGCKDDAAAGGQKVPAYTMTFYVTPAGKVTSVGFAGAEPLPDVYASCVVNKMKAAKLPSLGESIIKSTWSVAAGASSVTGRTRRASRR